MTYSKLIAAAICSLAVTSTAWCQPAPPKQPPQGVAPRVSAKELSSIEEKAFANPKSGKVADPKKSAEEILSNPEYRDSGVSGSRNWVTDAFQNVAEAIQDFLQKLFQRQQFEPNVPLMSAPTWIAPVMWGIIGVAIIAFLIWAIKFFNFGVAAKLRNKKVGGLLDDDEPDRTADEWLVRADELAAQGRHRESVRCLYLACLVRVDEAGVARFRRGETNWEHLRRIEASPRKPQDFEFKTPTQRFDLIWYGYQIQGQSDVDDFRQIYTDLCKKLQIKSAA